MTPRLPWKALSLALWCLAVVLFTRGALADAGALGAVTAGGAGGGVLVPEGEPEAILGVIWKDGATTFGDAPRVGAEARSVSWSADGKILASSGRFDETLRLLECESGFRVVMVCWAGDDGWVSWRASPPEGHRVLRGESGSLLRHRNPDGSLSPVVPAAGQRPRLSARVEVTQPAQLGVMGEAVVTVHNAADATPALWVEVQPTPGSAHAPASSLVFRPPATTLRIEPGESVRIPVEYVQAVRSNPRPLREKAVLALRHAHDQGKAIQLSVELPVQAPDIALSAKPPERDGDSMAVPVTLTNRGDQATGRKLAVSAEFVLPSEPASRGDGASAPERIVKSDFQTVYEEGLLPKKSAEFSLKVPQEAANAGRFRVRLLVTEGMAADMPQESSLPGMVSTWTVESPLLTPRWVWWVYAALALGLAVVGLAAYVVRVYRHPVVVAVASEPASLLRRPLRDLPNASRALERARRLDGVLGGLGIGQKRWQQTLGVAREPQKAASALVDVVGAELGQELEGARAWRARLHGLRLRFGPEVGVAALEGARVEPGEAQRLVEALRSAGAAAALLIDLTDAENGAEVFGGVARFSGVVLSSGGLRDVLLAAHPLRALDGVIARQRPVREISPYRTAGGVDEAAVFVGRSEELRKLADRDLHSCVLVGARQMGKSSLLKAAARRLATRQDVQVRYRVLASDDLPGELAAALGEPRPESIAAFQAMVRGTAVKPNVWLIDEADQFVESDFAKPLPERGAVAWALRALAEEGTTYFVLSGFWALFRTAVFEAGSPIRNFGELIRLGPLDADAARQLVREPMLSLGITVEDVAIEAILRETGCRANLVVLACQGLVERLAADQREVTLSDLQEVWKDHLSLRDALAYWKKEAPLDRALVHAALSLDRPTRRDIEQRLREVGIAPIPSELEQSFERLELGYVLLPEADPSGGADRWLCPVPLIPYFESRLMSWDEHLTHDAEQIRFAGQPNEGSS